MFSPLPVQALTIDVDAQDYIVSTQGILYNHYLAMECPLGIVDRFDPRAEHVEHDTCQGGLIYKLAGKVFATSTSNSSDKTLRTQGEIDASTQMFTFRRGYEDCDCAVTVGVYDKLEYAEEPPYIVQRQRIQYNSKTNIDRLQFPAIKIQILMDSEGISYNEGSDYILTNGNIVWIGNRPKVNPDTGRGGVYQVRYLYRPYWIVKSITKDIRVARQNNDDGSTLAKSNIAAICQREYQYMNEKNQNDAAVSTDPHQLPQPDDNGSPEEGS